MRKVIALLLSMLLLLSGCSLALDNIKEPVEFYYLRACSTPDDHKTYFTEGAIAPETREATGRRQDLYYLLSMYLRGPQDSQLVSPFPTGSTVVKIRQEDRKLTVYLNAVAANLEDFDLTLANACLAKTCLALADVDTVYIESRGINDKILFSATMTADDLILKESPPPSTDGPEETQ